MLSKNEYKELVRKRVRGVWIVLVFTVVTLVASLALLTKFEPATIIDYVILAGIPSVWFVIEIVYLWMAYKLVLNED